MTTPVCAKAGLWPYPCNGLLELQKEGPMKGSFLCVEHAYQANLSKLSMWYQPLLAGNWTAEEWRAAIDSVAQARLQYNPDSLTAIYRDIATNLQCQLNQSTKQLAEMTTLAHKYQNELWKDAK